VFLFLGLSVAHAQSEKAKELFNAGVDAETAGDLKTAKAKYEAAIAEDPNYANPHLNLGAILFKEKNYKEAQVHFSKVTELDSKNVDGWKNLGLAATKTGDLNVGDNAFSKALELKPNDPELIEAHAMLFYNNDSYERAIGKLEQLVKHKPKDKKIFYFLGKSYAEVGKTDEAVDNFSSAAKIDPEYHMAYFEMGNIYLDQEAWSRAISNYEKAVKYDSKHYQSWFNLGSACLGEQTANSVVRAYEAYKEFLSLTSGTKSSQIKKMRGQAQEITKQLVDYFDQAGIEYE
jgi:tetratricopeptide (TPR) repeat protein